MSTGSLFHLPHALFDRSDLLGAAPRWHRFHPAGAEVGLVGLGGGYVFAEHPLAPFLLAVISYGKNSTTRGN